LQIPVGAGLPAKTVGQSLKILDVLALRRQAGVQKSKKPVSFDTGFLVFGALDRIRTCDRSVRSRVLYPAELRVHLEVDKPDYRWLKQATYIAANSL
jgi:hypothetical protein